MTTDTVRSQINIDAPLGEVMGVLTDLGAYPDWAKAVRSVNVRETDDKGRGTIVEFEVSPGPLPKMRYVLHYRYEDAAVLWDYVEGDMKDVRGGYHLEQAGDTTSVVYELAIDPGSIPLPGFVKARAAREISKVALQDLKRRVEST